MYLAQENEKNISRRSSTFYDLVRLKALIKLWDISHCLSYQQSPIRPFAMVETRWDRMKFSKNGMRVGWDKYIGNKWNGTSIHPRKKKVRGPLTFVSTRRSSHSICTLSKILRIQDWEASNPIWIVKKVCVKHNVIPYYYFVVFGK